MLSRPTQILADLTVLATAFSVSYLIRFEFNLPISEVSRLFQQMPLVLAVQYLAIRYFGIYNFVWRYIGLAEVASFVYAALFSFFPLLCIRLIMPDTLHFLRVPISVICIDLVLAFGGTLGIRVLRRMLYEKYEKQRVGTVSDRKPVLLIGAGRAGVLAAREIQGRGDMDLKIVGFIDDDPLKVGTVINGVKVLGRTADIPRLVEKIPVDHVIITIAEASKKSISEIVSVCEKVDLKVRIIPGLYELLQGKVEISRIRDVQIEDLLGRDPVNLDIDALSKFICRKTVMVTGAGGSIGSELVRQIARFEPNLLLLVERAEYALFNIDKELRETTPELKRVPLIADVTDERRMKQIFEEYRPELVLHAAAHKHVPLMEYNPAEAIKNNVLGTRCVARLAGEYGTDVFVLISTDKAVRPASVMGASKRLAELIIQDLGRCYETRYLAVRFGNVIGSTGSVIPIFQEQIRKGGPVTVTHPDMTRYFMTIPEASQLVLQAASMGKGGEIFILDMGEPVRILDLATNLIRLCGMKPFEDIEIVFTGVRPGEKFSEELASMAEDAAKTRHPKIFIGRIESCLPEDFQEIMTQLEKLASKSDADAIRRLLSKAIPEANLSPAPDAVSSETLTT